MVDSRESGPSARAFVLVTFLLAPAACATGAPGDGISPVAVADPAVKPVAVEDAAPALASLSSPSSPSGSCSGSTVDEAGVASSGDAAEPDETGGGPSDEGGVDGGDEAALEPEAASSVASPAVGDLLVTEVMFEPSGTEPDSEWFEIYNLASSPRLLSGLTIEDGYQDTHVIASSPPVVVPAQAYVLLVRDMAAATAALVPAAAIVYEYGTGLSQDEGIELDDGATSDLSLWNGSTLLVDVPYGSWDAAYPGQSIELAASGSSPTDPASWCLAENPWANGSDDGTPGAPSDCP